MDRTLDVRTPESIAFSYELAGLGSRFLAVLLDLIVQLVILGLLLWGFFEIGIHAPHTAAKAPVKGDISEKVIANILIGFVSAVVFLIFFGYFILFEWLWNGQTPGKRALGIRAIRDGGYSLDFSASLVRNLIRVAEATLGFYVVACVLAVLSPENKRLGDLAAGTIVVRDQRMDSPADLLQAVRSEPVYASTAYVSGDERSIVKRFLERRYDLSPERRAELAHRIAERIRPRLPDDLQRLDDEDLLERL